MKIKIIKAEKHKWYYKHIGKTLTAMRISDKIGDDKVFVIRNYRTLLRTIPFNDAELLIS